MLITQDLPETNSFAVNTAGRLQPQVLADLGGSLFGELSPHGADQEVSLETI